MGILTVKMPWSPRQQGGNTSERDAEAEISRNLWRQYKLYTPASPRRSRWDWVLVVLVIFTSLQIPFVLVFNLPANARSSVKIVDYIIDVFFWVDILLQLNTSFYVDEQLVTSRKDILKHCFSSWMFYSDIAATFPWDDLNTNEVIDGIGCSRPSDGIDQGNLRVLRLLRLMRFAADPAHIQQSSR